MSKLHKPEDVDHARVAPTAWGVAYLRSLTDIPLAKEVFDGLATRLQSEGEPNPAWNKQRDRLAPILEARYKLLDKLISIAGNTQILELAAGIATHGTNCTKTNSNIKYVELDLPGVNSHKRAVLEKIGIRLPSGLSIIDGDALNPDDFTRAVATFDKNKPVTVINEGLMRYLSFKEKAKLAENVSNVLKIFGGVWITPDITLLSAMSRENEQARGHIQSVTQTTGIDLVKNVFEDEQHARMFFEYLGFTVESHSFLEVSDLLVSPVRIGMSAEEVTRLNDECFAFVMKLRDKM